MIFLGLFFPHNQQTILSIPGTLVRFQAWFLKYNAFITIPLGVIGS